jgi:hypothetical protein
MLKSKRKFIDSKVGQQQSITWVPQVGDHMEVPKLGGVARLHSVDWEKLIVTPGSMHVTDKLS